MQDSSDGINTTPLIRHIVAEILKIEMEYQNYQDLSHHKDKEKQLCDSIIQLIEREIKS
jgi:hypothetical protein